MDENLSVRLPETAHARGYEATHVNHYGLRQSADWDILKIVAEEDWILVTNNTIEFSRPLPKAGDPTWRCVSCTRGASRTANRAL